MNGAPTYNPFTGYSNGLVQQYFAPGNQQSLYGEIVTSEASEQQWPTGYNLLSQPMHSSEYPSPEAHSNYQYAADNEEITMTFQDNMDITALDPQILTDSPILPDELIKAEPSSFYHTGFATPHTLLLNNCIEPSEVFGLAQPNSSVWGSEIKTEANTPDSFSQDDLFEGNESGHTTDSSTSDPAESPILTPRSISSSPRPSAKNKATKASPKKKGAKQNKRTKAQGQQHSRSEVPKFFCTFQFAGCTETFGAKNEWKRHVSTQHFKFFVYVCNQGECASNPKASFARKDLFCQHLKRMHFKDRNEKDEDIKHELELLTELCKKTNREPPMAATCGHCGVTFEKDKAWDKRMEHVGEHYENGVDPREYAVDDSLLAWMRSHTIIEPVTSDPGYGSYPDASMGDTTTGYVLSASAKHTRHPARRRSEADVAKTVVSKKTGGRGSGRRPSGGSATAVTRPTTARKSVRARKPSVESFGSEMDAEGEDDDFQA